MKQYPKILHYNNGMFGEGCICFNKIDGSNFRAEWGKKRGWYKFGTRGVMIDKNTPIYGEGIDIFLNKYGEDLDNIFRTKYKSIESFVVFAEFLGENSFAGKHIDTDKKDIVIFDVNQYKRGFIYPEEFIKNFGHLDIPKIVYQGIYDEDLIHDIKINKYKLSEGVVCKGTMKTKKEGIQVWMCKVKTNKWIQEVKKLYGDKYLMEEFNNDIKMLKEYE